MKWSEPPPGLKKEEGDSKKFGTVPRILPEFGDCPLISYAMEGFWTFPDFRHVVQTRMRRMVPSTTARTRCKFGFQRRLVTLCACEMLLPKRGPFPQISQTLAMLSPYILLREAIKTFFLFRCQPGLVRTGPWAEAHGSVTLSEPQALVCGPSFAFVDFSFRTL